MALYTIIFIILLLVCAKCLKDDEFLSPELQQILGIITFIMLIGFKFI